MLSEREWTEKIRSAPGNTTRLFRKLSPAERARRLHQALHHENDAGLSSVDEYIYLRNKAAGGY